MNYKDLLKALIVSSISIFILSFVGGLVLGGVLSTAAETENNIKMAGTMMAVVVLVSFSMGAFVLIGFKEMTRETAVVGAVGGATINIIIALILLPPELVWSYKNFFGTVSMDDLSRHMQISYALQVVGGTFIAGVSAYFAGRVKLADFWAYQKKNQLLLIIGGALGAAILPALMSYAMNRTVTDVAIAYGAIGLVVGLFLAFLPDAPMNFIYVIALTVLGGIAGGIGRAVGYESTAEIGVFIGAGIGFAIALTYRRPTWMFLFLPPIVAGLSRAVANEMTGQSSMMIYSMLSTSGAAVGMTAVLMASFRMTTERVAVSQTGGSFALPQNGSQLVTSIQSIQNQVRDKAQQTVFEAQKLRQTTNMRVKQGSIVTEVDSKHGELGQLAYRLQVQRQVDFPTLYGAWRDIKQSQQTLQTTEKQLEALKKAGYQEDTGAGRLSAGVGKAAFEAEKLRQSRALQAQIKTMQGDHQQNLIIAGQQLHQLHQENQLPDHADVIRHCEEIDGLQETLAAHETEMTAVQETAYVSELNEAEPDTTTIEPAPSNFCRKCGTALTAGSQFCMRCGTAVTIPPTPQPAEPAAPPAPAISETPTAGDLFSQGVAQVKRSELPAGIQSLRQSLTQSPDNAATWLWMGIALGEQHNKEAAKKCFQKAQALGHPQAGKALLRLEEL